MKFDKRNSFDEQRVCDSGENMNVITRSCVRLKDWKMVILPKDWQV